MPKWNDEYPWPMTGADYWEGHPIRDRREANRLAALEPRRTAVEDAGEVRRSVEAPRRLSEAERAQKWAEAQQEMRDRAKRMAEAVKEGE